MLNDLLGVFSQSEHYDREIIKRDLSLILGIGVVEIFIEKINDDVLISLKEIPPLSFVIDKYSMDKNALDAKRFHKVLDMDIKEAEEHFNSKDFNTYNDGEFIERVVLIESWIKESGCLNRYIWQMDNKIFLAEQSPFKDSSHPFIISKFNIDYKNNFYGIFRDIKPMQDYINYAENRMSNMIGSFKAFYEEDAVSDKEAFVESASLDNSFTAIKPNGLEKIKFIDTKSDIGIISQKVAEKRQLAKVLSGVNDEVMGLGGTRQSGLAIQQRRDAGLMSLQDYIKVSDDMDRLIFSKVINYIKLYYTKEQVFKIVDKKVGDRYFKLDRDSINKIQVGKFDLAFKSSLKTLGREERFAHWSEILKTIASANPSLAPALLPLMLKDTDSPIIADIEEVIQAQEAQEQQIPQEQQALMQLELQKLQAQINELNAKALKYQAQGEAARNIAENTSGEIASKNGVDMR